MFQRLRRWLRGVLDRNEESEDSTFAGSLLDASVNYSHGQNDGRVVRELQRANEEASKLQDADERRP